MADNNYKPSKQLAEINNSTNDTSNSEDNNMYLFIIKYNNNTNNIIIGPVNSSSENIENKIF
ncbi:hypothetical protein H8356DRAFT_1337581 [Neocallimastix lanati (nom. inval.)]|nr:hypothetical protein H8356DRAFT_1337581 [Neocallimastix sp. JGI-2020a]